MAHQTKQARIEELEERLASSTKSVMEGIRSRDVLTADLESSRAYANQLEDVNREMRDQLMSHERELSAMKGYLLRVAEDEQGPQRAFASQPKQEQEQHYSGTNYGTQQPTEWWNRTPWAPR